MCGIVGYVGKQDAYPILIGGLQRLEYRGYDSAGIATLVENGAMHIRRAKGKLENLRALVGPDAARRPYRNRTYAVGHPWQTVRGKCASA